MKNFKKVLSVVLAAAMLVCSFAVAAAADEGDAFATVKSWGINDFNNFEGSGLTSEARHEVLSRDKSVGWQGYAIYGMPSGNIVTIKPGGTYIFEVDVDYSGLYVPGRSETESALIADFYIQSYDTCVETTFSAQTLQEGLDKGEFGYTDDGVRYFTISGEVTIPTEIGGEALLPELGGEARLWTRGIVDYRVINMRVLDADNLLSDPIGEWCMGDLDTVNDDSGIRTNPYVENSNYTLPRGFRVLRGDYEEPMLALGRAALDIESGDYAARYNLAFDGVFCADDDVLATIDVINSKGETVATKDIKKSDTTRSIKDSEGGTAAGAFFDSTVTAELPFTVTAADTYSAQLYTTGKANVTVTSVAFTAVIKKEVIEPIERLIDAIGDVKYDPDVNEDSKEAIDAARKACDDLAKTYGDISTIVSNYAVLTAAETAYQGKVSEYNDMVDAGALVDEAISAIPTPITLECGEYIEAAENARDAFIETYSQEKAQLHIKKLADLAQDRMDYDALAKEDIVYGDVDGDSKVTANDALEALQASIGARQLDERATKAADVDKDEKVTANDALCILQVTVGAREALPVE